ncbi:hypothetical protein HOL63_01550 [Candidatus Peregrinibacteria bacterium]|jgi:hypothetical protein|nr:hypothetical protein [Candidatus Peregrinibacteria bacterium]MBT5468146.1 hypothetical protein [Candidatus Peregrinibacteria bacterium]MBT7337956.1 hypothetical protein [Candidatus Peregrinibacteria bacterium]
MKNFSLLLALFLLPTAVSAEEISFLVETTYASSEVQVVPTVLPTGRAGATSSQASVGIIEETMPSSPVPVTPPVDDDEEYEDYEEDKEYEDDEEDKEYEDDEEYKEPVQKVSAPAPVYTVKEQEELDDLTLEQLEEYADEAEQSIEEQLTQLEDGFTVMGSSVMDDLLSPTQRAAILRRSIRTVGQLKIFTKALSESDENIRQVKLGDEKIEISYRQKAKLFGLIPLNYLLKTTVKDGEVEVKQPWWHFLARDDVKSYKTTLQEQLDLLGDIDPEDPDLEVKLQRQQQTLQTLSNMSKMLHDTGMLKQL